MFFPCKPRVSTLKLSVILILLIAAPAAGQTSYSLKDCLNLARQRHPRIQLQHFQTVQAEELSKAARTEFLPKLEAGYSYTYRDKINSYDIDGLSFPANTHDLYNLDITLTQPLFTGFKIMEKYRLAQLGIKQARAEEELAYLEITYETVAAYFNYLKQLKFAETATRTVARLESQAHDSQLFFDNELIPLNDLLYSKVKLSQAQQQQRRVETAVLLSRAQLATIIQIDRDSLFAVDDEPTQATMPFSLEKATAIALSRRPELSLANFAIASAGHQIKLAQSDYYPSLYLQATHSRMGDKFTVDGDGLTSTPYNTFVSIGATWKLWEWDRSGHQVRNARAELEGASQTLKQVEDEIALEIKNNFTNAATSYSNIATAAEEVKLGKENYRVTKLRYQNQLSTATEVLDSQAALTEAEASYYNALYEYNIQLAALARAAGVDSWQSINTSEPAAISEKSAADRSQAESQTPAR
ncbi:MAG: TolC family protein [Deltaproteobacteria bacterium]|nr:TolC family protein [Deltaproteobacteria bacterium]